MLNPARRRKLVEFIKKSFDLEELEELCTFLGISYGEIRGETLSAKANALIGYVERRDQVGELVHAISEARESAKEELQEFNPIIREKQKSYGYIPEFPIVMGRQSETEEIIRFLNGEQRDENKCVLVLHGMPGIGKTTLVAGTIEHHNVERAFSEIVWVPLENGSDEFLNYLAQVMSVHYPTLTQKLTLSEIIKILKEEKVLLVLDGAENFFRDRRGQTSELEDFLEKLRPRYKGKVIVTTQQYPVRLRNIQPLEIGPLSLEASEEWFLYCWESRARRRITDQVRREAKEICKPESLGGHPLAIETMALTAAYSFNKSLQEYRRQLRRGIELDQGTILDSRMYTRKSVTAVLELAFNQLSADALRLLGRISFLPSTFPINALKQLSQVRPSLDLDILLNELIRCSLVTINEEDRDGQRYCHAHSLVRALARKAFIEPGRYSEVREIQKVAGMYMTQTNESAHWMAGMKNLLQAEAFQEFILRFRDKYGWLGNVQLFEAEDLPDVLMKPCAYYCMAWISNEKGWVEEAINYSMSVRELLSDQPDSHLKDVLLLRTAAIGANNLRHKKEEDSQMEAKQMLADAFASLDKRQEPNTRLDWEVGQLYLLEGILFAQEFDTAQAALEKAKNIYDQLQDTGQYLKALSSLATILVMHQKDISRSVELTSEVIEKINLLPDSLARERQEISEIINIADSLITLGQFSEAARRVEYGMKFAEERMLKWARLPLLINLAKVEIHTKRLTDARKHLLECKELAIELSNASYDEEINGCFEDLERIRSNST